MAAGMDVHVWMSSAPWMALICTGWSVTFYASGRMCRSSSLTSHSSDSLQLGLDPDGWWPRPRLHRGWSSRPV